MRKRKNKNIKKKINATAEHILKLTLGHRLEISE